jgi:hypothetical protein
MTHTAGQVWQNWGAVIVVTVLGTPFAAALAWALASRRAATGGDGWHTAWRDSIAEVGMVAGTLPWIWMVFRPWDKPRRVELVPLRGLLFQLHDVGTATVQIGGNLLVFAAFGALAPVRWRLGPTSVVVIAAGASAVVETLQYTLDLGRVSAVDDVLVNAFGAGVAAFCSRPWWRRRDTG